MMAALSVLEGESVKLVVIGQLLCLVSWNRLNVAVTVNFDKIPFST